MNEQARPEWPLGIFALTIFVTDLQRSKDFYIAAFGRPVLNEDESAVAFRLGSTILNVLVETAAPELIGPAVVADAASGSRFMPTITVDDVDARAALLAEAGIELINGPTDRPWGPRTAAFTDPDGHVWEIAH